MSDNHLIAPGAYLASPDAAFIGEQVAPESRVEYSAFCYIQILIPKRLGARTGL
jgi:hypothetical protein